MKNKLLPTVLLTVIVMLAIGTWGLVLGARHDAPHYAIADTQWGRDLGYFLVNLGPELAGIVIGVVVIDALNDWRQDNQLKEQLILQMSSKHNDVTDMAIRTLRARGWLEDESLKGANLSKANLYGADLFGANLIGAKLSGADLIEALGGADLILGGPLLVAMLVAIGVFRASGALDLILDGLRDPGRLGPHRRRGWSPPAPAPPPGSWGEADRG